MKKHYILALLLAALMLVPANVMASACDRTSKEPSSSRERVEQLRDSGLGTVEAADPIDPEEEITAIVFLLCFCIAKLEMCHFLTPCGAAGSDAQKLWAYFPEAVRALLLKYR